MGADHAAHAAQPIMNRANPQFSSLQQQPIDDIPNDHLFHTSLTAVQLRHAQPIADLP
jgi:hypothetical protein